MEKILIIRTDHLGDLVLTTPLVRALSLEGYEVSLLIRKAHSEILENNKYVYSYHSIEDIAPLFPKGWYKISKWIRDKNFDVLLIPYAIPNELILISLFSNVQKKLMMRGRILGRLTGNVCLRSDLFKNHRHFADLWLDFARYLNIDYNNIHPDIFLTENELSRGKEMIKNKFNNLGKVIGIHPGHGGNTCNLGFDEYKNLIRLVLNNTNWNIIVTGNEFEKLIIDKWDNSVIESPRVWNSSGELNLRQLSSIIKYMDLFLCSGTGPLHIANAVNTKTLSPLCSRVGHSDIYWGNTNGMGNAVNVHTNKCDTKNGFCKFEGKLTGKVLFDKTRDLLNDI